MASAADFIIAAGPKAYQHIQQHGLSPDHISTIFGASGAAKWLTIAGLDSAVFGDFMHQRQNPTPVGLYGTSVGALKLAAAARTKPVESLAVMAEAYIQQSYSNGMSRQIIADETSKILTKVINAEAGGVDEILSNSRYYLHVGAVRCHGLLNNTDFARLGAAMGVAGLGAMFTPRHLRGMTERTIFSDPRSDLHFTARDGYPVRKMTLTRDNLRDALVASGSIPIYMHGVRFAEDPQHLYHDGGMLDYHPIPSAFWPAQDGLVLYPHFMDYFKIRWFDKFYRWRRATGSQLDTVVMLAPTPAFVASLPNSKIPDRHDFISHARRDHIRIDNWRHVISRSHDLGAQFLELVKSGDIAARVVAL